jgi:predicted phosphate transport protein (TIGR00153 family)
MRADRLALAVRISLIPRNRQFQELLARAGRNLVEISEALCVLLDEFPETRMATRIRELERAGDEITHEIVRMLNSTFVTPLDREDVYALSGKLDDVCDHVDEAADELVLYGVRHVRPAARAQADVIRRAAERLAAAIDRLDGLRDARDDLVAVHTLENEGDRLEREAIAELFAGGEDALVVIRWKDIHDRLEAAVDSCEQAAAVLETIYLKSH